MKLSSIYLRNFSLESIVFIYSQVYAMEKYFCLYYTLKSVLLAYNPFFFKSRIGMKLMGEYGVLYCHCISLYCLCIAIILPPYIQFF
ncbi:hypothetical protein ACE6H2_016350 [Prunus campanulata]